MEKEFVPKPLVIKLVEVGFDEPCFAVSVKTSDDIEIVDPEDWDGEKYGDLLIRRPTFSQAFRWFREKHGWIGSIWQFSISKEGISSFEYAIDTLNDLGVSQYRQDFPFTTYEEAELACLEKLIDIVLKTA